MFGHTYSLIFACVGVSKGVKYDSKYFISASNRIFKFLIKLQAA